VSALKLYAMTYSRPFVLVRFLLHFGVFDVFYPKRKSRQVIITLEQSITWEIGKVAIEKWLGLYQIIFHTSMIVYHDSIEHKW